MKVLCHTDVIYDNPNTDEYSEFKKGKLYELISITDHNLPGKIPYKVYLVFDGNNDHDKVFFHNIEVKSGYNFFKYFYDPEETKRIIRDNKIKDILK